MEDIIKILTNDPTIAGLIGVIIIELVVKYSPWKGTDGLIEAIAKGIVNRVKK